jgi:hypothetical protein
MHVSRSNKNYQYFQFNYIYKLLFVVVCLKNGEYQNFKKERNMHGESNLEDVNIESNVVIVVGRVE